jgi:4-amino-4-deoxy-L-arabinose transferase-like glycosyltransferase
MYSRILFFTLLIAIRVFIALGDVYRSHDSVERYIPLARQLLQGNGYADKFDMPLYPVFLAAVYLFGDDRLVVIVQLVIEILTVYLVYLSAGKLLSARGQYLATAFAAFFPMQAVFAARILTESNATFLTVAAFYFYTVKRPVYAGLAMALGVLTRPDLILVALFILPLFRRDVLRYALPVVILLGAWTGYQASNPFGGVSGQTSGNYVKWLGVWLDHPRYIDAYWWRAKEAPPLPEIVPDRERAEAAMNAVRETKSLDNIEFNDLAARAKNEAPFKVYIIVPLKRAFLMVTLLPTYVTGIGKIILFVFWFALLTGAAVGVFYFPNLFPVAVIAARLALPIYSPLGSEPRYFLEAVPFICLLAAPAVSAIYRKVSAQSRLHPKDASRQESN